jgi:fructose-1,6-bisphosphatase
MKNAMRKMRNLSWIKNLPNGTKRELCDHVEYCEMKKYCGFGHGVCDDTIPDAFCDNWHSIDDFKLMVFCRKYGRGDIG